jgi:hypothetical protein
MSEGPWGKVDLQQWQTLPHVTSRLASEADVQDGRAVFFLGNTDQIDTAPYDVDLPHCALLVDEESGEKLPVIIVQAERAGEVILVGYRFLTGGNGICTLPEIELLDQPDNTFHGALRET